MNLKQAIKHHASFVFAISNRAKHYACCHVHTNFTPNVLINGCGWVHRQSSWLILNAFQFPTSWKKNDFLVDYRRSFILSITWWGFNDDESFLCFSSSSSSSSFIFSVSHYHFLQRFFSPFSQIERVQSVVEMHPTISKVVVKSNKLQYKEEEKKLIFRHNE